MIRSRYLFRYGYCWRILARIPRCIEDLILFTPDTCSFSSNLQSVNHSYRQFFISTLDTSTTTNKKHSNTNVHVDYKANRMLGMIRRAYTFLDGPILTKLYTSLIRPLLEYSNVAWTPVLKRERRSEIFSWRMSKDVRQSWFLVSKTTVMKID